VGVDKGSLLGRLTATSKEKKRQKRRSPPGIQHIRENKTKSKPSMFGSNPTRRKEKGEKDRGDRSMKGFRHENPTLQYNQAPERKCCSRGPGKKMSPPSDKKGDSTETGGRESSKTGLLEDTRKHRGRGGSPYGKTGLGNWGGGKHAQRDNTGATGTGRVGGKI